MTLIREFSLELFFRGKEIDDVICDRLYKRILLSGHPWLGTTYYQSVTDRCSRHYKRVTIGSDLITRISKYYQRGQVLHIQVLQRELNPAVHLD